MMVPHLAWLYLKLMMKLQSNIVLRLLNETFFQIYYFKFNSYIQLSNIYRNKTFIHKLMYAYIYNNSILNIIITVPRGFIK